MKNIEIISATEFTFPSATNTRAIISVTSELLIGSLSLSRPLASQLFICGLGKALSEASAWSVLGATIIEPKAEEIVEAASPRGTTQLPCIAILPITNWLFTRSSTFADITSL